MKTFYKRIISLLLIPVLVIAITFSNTVKTKAIVPELLSALSVVVPVVVAVESDSDYQNWYQNTFRPVYTENVGQLLSVVGFPTSMGPALYPYIGDPIQNLRIWMSENSGVDESNITDDQVKQKYYEMYGDCTVNTDNDTFVISSEMNSFMKYMINEIIENSGYRYVYTFNIINYATNFSSGELYEAIRDFISSEDENGNTVAINSYGFTTMMVADLENAGFVNQAEGALKVSAKPYDYTTWQPVTGYEYIYNTANGVYPSGASGNNMNATLRFDKYGLVTLDVWNWVSVGKNKVFKLYNSLNDLKADSVGQSPYYINNSIYNDYSNSTGDYTLSYDNSNKVTYGDIQNYVDNSYTENGTYPTPTEINIYIEDSNPIIPNPTPTPGPGGGGSGEGGQGGQGGSANATANNEGINITINNNHSLNFGGTLSGNSVSGNGTGSSGGIGSIFGWLGDLGQVLGDLIKNLGEALKNVLKGISDLITSIVTDLPTMFFDFIGAFFGWMPPEWSSLLSLSLAAMLIFGIIKIFRG